ncbi:hypothetical protein B5M09_012103 [Aphanomyces astaci]|uniref:Transcription factor IIIC 90kDa subunit N-terminal domain-containing protein n=1 Tax=Aphanomyces astaci TaxID=112090 RepID=A0A425CV59_APHAT|nr:hypothetical protein B5M09_012103 [Aphanomyces astaci]
MPKKEATAAAAPTADPASNEHGLQFTATSSSFSSEHLPGAPILPGCVHWSADCKLACVTDENIMISTYLNKDLSSAPNMSCAIATLTSSGQVGVYYPSTLDLQWKEVVSVSSLLKRHVAANSWSHVTAAIEAHNATDLLVTVPLSRFPQQQKNKASINAAFDAKRQKLSASFVDKVELQSVTTLAWSTATYDPTTGASMSYVALCGKRLSTVWRYEHNYAGTDGLFTSRLDESPVATAVTGVYGWPTCSAWMLMETDAIVVGTSSGNVLMMRLTRQEGSGGRMALEVERVLRTPQLQPVYALHYSLSRVCVAAGNTITVWPNGGDEGAPLTWQAHSHNISCLDVDLLRRVRTACVELSMSHWKSH